MNRNIKEKIEQHNALCLTYYNDALVQIDREKPIWKKYRNCQATFCETECYYVLKSYDTIIGVANKSTHDGFDVLRFVYHFTNTSAQHLSKFFNDYAHKIYRWRVVK